MKTTKKALQQDIIILNELVEAQKMEIARLQQHCADHRENNVDLREQLEISRKDNAILARQNGELALELEKVKGR